MAVRVGNIYIGSGYPVVIQSMTSTDTNDIQASVSQCIRIIEAGAQMVRLTTQGLREVESLSEIRTELRRRGYDQPLAADVHFLPKVAIEAAKVADKVRINPGNYVEKNYHGPLQFDLSEQQRQVADIRERLLPLISTCREYGTAVRIGVNHGSLSRRILSWYGDTPEGMVESAMEFIRIFAGENFHQLVVSLKASDSRIMVYANRLLVKRMKEENLVYPLHLGVTEAGAEEDGIIKSSAGISTLLAEGIGDTIRVSLTEDPEHEIPVAAKIVEYFACITKPVPSPVPGWDPCHYFRRETTQVENTGNGNVQVVIAGSSLSMPVTALLKECGYIDNSVNTLEMTDKASDYVFIGEGAAHEKLPAGINFITQPGGCPDRSAPAVRCHVLASAGEFRKTKKTQEGLRFVKTEAADFAVTDPERTETGNTEVLVLNLPDKDAIGTGMKCYGKMKEANDRRPVILHRTYHSADLLSLMVKAAGEFGALLTNGFGDGIWIEEENPSIAVADTRETAFSILQATKTRISGTEYISCPSCGRTLFDIQDTLRRIKAATVGMKGVKIAVMGCIVNGPGEMADADYGYVGAGRGKVTLYKGHEAVKKNIPEEKAVEELIKIISLG